MNFLPFRAGSQLSRHKERVEKKHKEEQDKKKLQEGRKRRIRENRNSRREKNDKKEQGPAGIGEEQKENRKSAIQKED